MSTPRTVKTRPHGRCEVDRARCRSSCSVAICTFQLFLGRKPPGQHCVNLSSPWKGDKAWKQPRKRKKKDLLQIWFRSYMCACVQAECKDLWPSSSSSSFSSWPRFGFLRKASEQVFRLDGTRSGRGPTSATTGRRCQTNSNGLICKIKFIKYFVERERSPRSLWGNVAEVVAEDGEGPCVALVGSRFV